MGGMYGEICEGYLTWVGEGGEWVVNGGIWNWGGVGG